LAVGLQLVIRFRELCKQSTSQAARRPPSGQAVVDMLALAEAIQQARVTQDTQVPRYTRLTLAKDIRELCLGKLAGCAKIEQTQAGGIRTGFKSLQQCIQTGLAN